MKSKKYGYFSVFCLVVLLHACGGGVTGDAKNYVSVDDQTLINLNEISLAQVSLQEPAWVVVYESAGPHQAQGNLDHVIGLLALDPGSYQDLKVSLDRDAVDGETLFIELRKNAGDLQRFEPQGPDGIISQASVSSVGFTVSHYKKPYLSAEDAVIANEHLLVDKVITDRDSWLVAYTYDETAADKLGSVIGVKRLLRPGHCENADVFLLLGKSTQLNDGDKIVVALFANMEDMGQADDYDPTMDVLLENDGQKLIQVKPVSFRDVSVVDRNRGTCA